MASIQYSDSPNVDTAFVVDGDKKHRAVLTAQQDTSTLELPDNPNSTKGYVTVDGKKHKVILTANIAGGSDVSSVNGKTGAVVLDAKDVNAIPQYETMPTASADNAGEVAQYIGETDEYTNGYFYKSSATYSDPTATISQTAGSGLTDLAVDLDTFVAEEQPTQSENVDFVYTDSDASWTKGGETVDIADYGITYTGTPVDNDTLTVVYTAPTLTGYTWNQINVQPQPVIPEPTDINWATSVDLPDDFAYGSWNCLPIYTVAGGLPDGTYDFYWQVKCLINTDTPLGVVTYHARMTIDNTNHTFYGMFEPVVDKDWLPSDSYIPGDKYIYSFVRTVGSDLILYNTDEQAWKSNIPDMRPGLAVPDCFKISVITNIDTGEEYTPTGVLYNGNLPQYDWQYNGTLRMLPFAQNPYIPQYHTQNSVAFDSSNRHLLIETDSRTPITANELTAVCSEVDFVASTSSGGTYHIVIENSADRYVARVLEATGDLATAQMYYAKTNSNQLVFGFNSAGNSGTLTYGCGVKGSAVGVNCNLQNTMNALTPVDIANVGETVGINNIGLIEQYKGATDANYTNGYFYKSEGTVVPVPQSMTASGYQIGEVPVNDVTIDIDIDSLIPALAEWTGWSQSLVKSNLQNNSNWYIHYSFDLSTVIGVWWAYWGYIDSHSITNCFTVSTTGSYTGSDNIFFTGTYTPASQSVSGGTWTRVDVQPLDLTGVTGYDATKTQVLKNVQGTLTWVDE